ncbi:MAG TPA: acyl carrier protein [Pseudonocardiaceae bacterium]|nr:acyl carrier protein [Pseudonocardiaceae bacterium]
MSQFTLDDLLSIMRSSVGVEDTTVPDKDVADVEFADLGLDSLAVLELAGEVQRRYGVVMSDDVVVEMPSLGAAVDYINRQLVGAGR